MINFEQIQNDISELPEEAQTLVIDCIESLKKQYSVAEKQEVKSTPSINNQSNTLDILKESGLIGCISAESDLSINYLSVLKEGLDTKYDNR